MLLFLVKDYVTVSGKGLPSESVGVGGSDSLALYDSLMLYDSLRLLYDSLKLLYDSLKLLEEENENISSVAEELIGSSESESEVVGPSDGNSIGLSSNNHISSPQTSPHAIQQVKDASPETGSLSPSSVPVKFQQRPLESRITGWFELNLSLSAIIIPLVCNHLYH
jgi:hypothetical protein